MAKRIVMALMITAMFLGPGSGTLTAFELEGFGGALTQRDALEGGSNPLFGLRFGGGGRRIVSGETTLAYSPTDQFKVILLLGNFDINIPIDKVIPYVTFGTGTFIYLPQEGAQIPDPDDPSTFIAIANTKTKFSVNYGGGVRYLLNDMVALRGDFRDHIIFDLGFDVNPDAESAEDVIDIGTSHSIEASLGLSILFF